MKRQLAIIFLLAACAASLAAKDIDIRKYGAKPDGRTKCTKAIQKAIDEVSLSGGGRVIVSPGTYMITPFELKSGVELFIDAGATLLASPDLKDYPERENPKHYLSEGMPRFRNASIIYADEAENIAISGRGTIDCNGTQFVKPKEGEDWKGWHFERIAPRRESLPRVVFFAGCKNVRVSDITMTNQPSGWSFWIHDCDLVHFDGVNILADVRYPNNDGIHINSCRDVTVSNCIIETGDDSIVIRANNRSLRENKICERIVITNCTLHSWSSAIRFGWTNDGLMRNIAISNIVIRDSSKGICCSLPKMPSKTFDADSNDYGNEPTRVENVSFSNIQMYEIYGNPICFVVAKADDVLFGGFKDITFSNISVHKSIAFPYFSAREDAPAENIVFDNCLFERVPASELPENPKRHGAVRNEKPGSEVNVQGLVLNNTRFVTK